jgi:circadian clock protein KaiB
MTAPPHPDLVAGSGEPYHLTLFVSGASELSGRAIAAARQLCDLHLRGRGRLTVIDVHVEPEAAVSSRVQAVPALVRTRPLPVRRVVGDLSRTEHVLSVLLASAGDGEERPA